MKLFLSLILSLFCLQAKSNSIPCGDVFSTAKDLVESHIKRIAEVRAKNGTEDVFLTREEAYTILMAYAKKDPSVFIGATKQAGYARLAYRMPEKIESVDDLPTGMNEHLNLHDTARGSLGDPAYDSDYMKKDRGHYLTFQMGEKNGQPLADFYIPPLENSLYTAVSTKEVDPAQLKELLAYFEKNGIELDPKRLVGVRNADINFLFDAGKIFGDSEFGLKVDWGTAIRKEEEPATISLKMSLEYAKNGDLVLSEEPNLANDPILGPIKSADKLKLDPETGIPLNHELIPELTNKIRAKFQEQ